MTPVHMRRSFLREERFQNVHLSKSNRENCDSDKDAPNHDSLIKFLSSVSTLSLPQSVVGLIINDCIQILVNLREITYLRTSSSFVRLKIARILFARLGPRRRGTESSVRPATGESPSFTMARLRTAISCPTMHPRIDLRFLSPARRCLYPLCPLCIRRRTRVFVRMPWRMGKPCLSFPPVMRRT